MTPAMKETDKTRSFTCFIVLRDVTVKKGRVRSGLTRDLLRGILGPLDEATQTGENGIICGFIIRGGNIHRSLITAGIWRRSTNVKQSLYRTKNPTECWWGNSREEPILETY